MQPSKKMTLCCLYVVSRLAEVENAFRLFKPIWDLDFFVLTMFQVLWKIVDNTFSCGDKSSPMEEDISI